MNHRTASLIAIICAAALMLPGMPGFGEGPRGVDMLDINFSLNPGELVAPGDTTMTFIITNRSGYDVKNLYLSSADGQLSEPIGQIGPGETQTLSRPHAVTQEELDEGYVRYVITHDSPIHGGDKVTHELAAPVVKSDPRPEVDFTRQLSSEYVAPGGLLTITYRVTNSGNVPVTSVYVRDELGDFTGKLEKLDVGASRTFISRVTVNTGSQSEASLEYRVPSGDTVTRKLDNAVIHMSSSALDVEFSVGRSVFDPDRADAVLILTNRGNDDYYDITVLDDVYGGVIADSVTLPRQSRPMEVGFTYPVRGEGEYRWRVTGVSQAGEALDVTTETLTLHDETMSRAIDIDMSVAALTPRINRAGRVTFDVAVANRGTVTARNLRIYEVSRGDVRKLAVLPTGEPCRFTVEYDVRESGQYIFCLDYTDAEGRARTISSEPIDVQITVGGVTPEQLGGEPMNLEADSVKLGTTSTFSILLGVASAAVVSMFIILLATSMRARQIRRRRTSQKKKPRENPGKAGVSTPVKGRGQKARGARKKP